MPSGASKYLVMGEGIMKHLVRINDYTKEDVFNIFKIANGIEQGKYHNALQGKTVVLFFPNSSIRTRVTFEKGIFSLGGQPILFSSDVLDKKEDIKDVIGYLNNWADFILVRHNDIELIEEMTKYSKIPIINAMTSINHPCEILSDLYALSKIRKDFLRLKYIYVGPASNIGKTWAEAAKLFGFSFIQSCPKGYEIEDIVVEHNINKAINDSDIVLTDSLSKDKLIDFQDYQITVDLIKKANKNAVLNPCPPFFRGEEVSEDIIESKYFVGYEFKKSLLSVQQAIIIYSRY